MSKHTPGPWQTFDLEVFPVDTVPNSNPNWMWNGDAICSMNAAARRTNSEHVANARLIAAAPDHALFAKSIVAGLVRWEPFAEDKSKGEICCNGMRYTTQLDDFGVPAINASIR